MFFKRKNDNYGLIDIHSHILPMVDDGSINLDTTIKMAQTAVVNGFKKIVATPHFKTYVKSANPSKIDEEITKLNSLFQEKGINITLFPGNEIMRFEEAVEFLNAAKIKTLNNTNYILVEFKPYDSFSIIKNDILSLMSAGYDVILAHVERYECITNDIDYLYQLKNMNVLTQINYSSVLSKHKEIKKFVDLALDEYLVDFVASDAHDTDKRSYDVIKTVKYLYKKYDNEYVDELLRLNAIRYLNIGE